MTTDIPPSTTPPPQPPPAQKTHILVTGASSGLGRAFFEHFSSFPPTTHQVRGIDARPYPTHLTASSCEVGACGRFNQVDLTAEALVQKFVRNATVPGAAAAAQSRSHSRSASNPGTPVSPTITYRERHHHHHHHQHHHNPRQQQLSVASDSQSSAAPTPPPSSSSATSSPPPPPSATPAPENDGNSGGGGGGSSGPTATAAATAAATTPYTGPFTLVIHSAGIRGLVPSHEAARPDDVAGAETIAAMDAATMRRAYEINAVATFTLVKALLPSFRSSYSSSPDYSKPKVVIMASRMGSVASNGGSDARGGGSSNAMAGGAYAYRASKAALNAIVRSFSHDVPEVDFALVHPGRVQTGLVRAKEEGAIEVGESVADVLRLIDRIGVEEGLGSGCFVDRWGNAIPW
ncbi:Glucose/ribitol dehydrogenase [Lasiodiplodia theobromae]|uniref:C-factor n=1 Tax=Lasiodiplodia theobromae TaxID=45133 RepID=A0A5N5D2E2_9PEZI|nr:Glucose/ribitol dehydrogenase [Lasiodiplodia theobromae]KAB2571721.1 C-factor [Lasiodiplodia theobromae]KAF4539012.1 Glucose/ribitol dehydrogenase [Lasiodiplodia theobromae]KAF9637301.1 Glucose/ribitol dehydrogenase [Lasiodiplodia theobromae]